MDNKATIIPEEMREFELEIMLHINERLFRNSGITENMYNKAKELIVKA